VRRNLRLRW